MASGSEISQRRDPQITPNVLAHCRTSNFDGRRGEKRSLKLFGGEGRREGPGVSAEKRRSKEGVGTELGNCLCHVNSARCSLITFPLFFFFFFFFRVRVHVDSLQSSEDRGVGLVSNASLIKKRDVKSPVTSHGLCPLHRDTGFSRSPVAASVNVTAVKSNSGAHY